MARDARSDARNAYSDLGDDRLADVDDDASVGVDVLVARDACTDASPGATAASLPATVARSAATAGHPGASAARNGGCFARDARSIGRHGDADASDDESVVCDGGAASRAAPIDDDNASTVGRN
ncbi:MAG: hypothetical protein IPN16_18745 [Gemmatimonadetes bacterium]|nr:hypothetical protein [Gemmatimonadota bacterium]